jgi:hypothetical protein
MNHWDGLSRFLGKVRPQIFLALTILGIIAYVGIKNDLSEVSIGCMAGIIALAKDVLQSDA